MRLFFLRMMIFLLIFFEIKFPTVNELRGISLIISNSKNSLKKILERLNEWIVNNLIT